jgi:hypothetical protein
MVTYVTKGGTQKLPQKFKIVETYWHDHSLESCWGGLSDGTISFSIHSFFWEKMHFLNFSEKPQSLSYSVNVLNSILGAALSSG